MRCASFPSTTLPLLRYTSVHIRDQDVTPAEFPPGLESRSIGSFEFRWQNGGCVDDEWRRALGGFRIQCSTEQAPSLIQCSQVNTEQRLRRVNGTLVPTRVVGNNKFVRRTEPCPSKVCGRGGRPLPYIGSSGP